MSYFMETICKLYIGGCIAAGEGEGGGHQPGEGRRQRGRETKERNQHSRTPGTLCELGMRWSLEDMTDPSSSTDYCPLCVTRP